MSPRQRPYIYAAAAFVAVWILAIAGYSISQHAKMSPEKIRAYIEATDFDKLTGKARADAIRGLADRINRLTWEERRHARVGRLWAKWFESMTEEEKSAFLDATLPTGFKQAITAFEKLPPEKRQKALDAAVKRLKEARENPELAAKGNAGPRKQESSETSTNSPPVLSDDLQKKIVMTGLKTFYTQSSAESKAELAPLLEEIQRSLQSGRLFRGNH